MIAAGVLLAAMVLLFGEMRWLWEKRYQVAVNFKSAPGVQSGTPVRKNGINIGTVREVFFEEDQGGVTVLVDIKERHVLRKDTQVRLNVSLIGDASIEFTPGHDREVLKPGARLQGELPLDPVQLVVRLEAKVSESLDSFMQTSREWNAVASNLNGLLESNSGNLQAVVERASAALQQFSVAMETTNKLLGDPSNQKNIRDTLKALPEMVRDTQRTIQTVSRAVEHAEANLENLRGVTEPLSKHSASIVSRLDHSTANLDRLLADLSKFSHLLVAENGSLKMLATDPDLYRNLNRAAGSLDTLLRNLQPVMQDVRVLSDRLARHPELLGVGGALRGSNGLKSLDEAPAKAPRTSAQPGQNRQ